MDYSPWVPKTRTRLSDFTFTLIQYDWYSSEKRKDTETDRGKRYVTREMPMTDTDHQKLGERHETDLPQRLWKGSPLLIP